MKTDEIWPLGNILNEICNGVSVDHFEEKIGAKEEDVQRLLEKLSQTYRESKELQEIPLTLDEAELQILEKSFKELLNHLDWDFQTRVGITIAEAQKIIIKLRPN